MEFIFVDKNKNLVMNTCMCTSEQVKKYSRIDDFTYEEIEDIEFIPAEQLYFGFEVDYRLPSSGGYIASIPGHGAFFWELIDIWELKDIVIHVKGFKEPLDISEGTVVIISRREKFECLPVNDLVQLPGKFKVFLAFYSLTGEKVCDEKCTLGVVPIFEKIGASLDESSKYSYRLVLNSNEIENESFFRSKLGESVFNDLGLKEYVVNQHDAKFFVSNPLKANEILSFAEIQKQSIFLPELTILKIEDKPITKDRSEFSKAMTNKFERSDRIFLPFQSYVMGAASHPDSEILARFFHMAQSSGTGKTKLCLHLLKELNAGIYCVYRLDDSTGFPESISWTADLISEFKTNTTSDDSAVELCLAFILASLQTFQSYGDEDPIVLYSDPVNSILKEFAVIFNDNLNENRKKTANQLKTEINAINSQIPSGSCFPIIIDECQEFLCQPKGDLNSTRISLYRAFRRAMISIKCSKVVAIFLGTKSSLNEFVQNYRIDASARPGEDVMPISPYIFVHSFDLFFTGDIKLSHSNLIEKKISRFLTPETLMQVAKQLGRPLWNAYSSYIRAFGAAKLKLAADTSISRLTAFVLRTGAPVVPSCELAHKIVLSGMALLQYVDVFGENCEVSYCPEPVLSSAARLYAGSLDNLRIVLKEFLGYVDKRSVLDLGSAGEFVARIVILRTVDYLAEVPFNFASAFPRSIDDTWLSNIKNGSKRPSIPDDSQVFSHYALFTLREFLKTLGNLSDSELNDLNLSTEMLDGLVNVSQFVTVKRPYNCDQLDLLHGFIRATGYCLPTNWPGADLMIPVFRSDNRFSCVMVQVKNLDQLSIPGTNTNLSNEIIGKMTSKYINLDLSAKGDFDTVPENEFAKVVIQFAEPRTTKVERKQNLKKIVPSANGGVLWILGLEGFYHLFTPAQSAEHNTDIIKYLETIVNGSRDYINRINNYPVNIQPSQNTQAGIRTLLHTSVPILTSDYLSFHDPAYKNHYPDEFKRIKKQANLCKLSSQVNSLQVKLEQLSEYQSEEQSTNEPIDSETEADNSKKRSAADSTETIKRSRN